MVRILSMQIWIFLVATISLAQETAAPHKEIPAQMLHQKHEASRTSTYVARPMFSVKSLEAAIPAKETSTKETRRESWEYKDAYLFWLRQRSFPYDTINWLAYVRAFLHLPQMPRMGRRVAPGLLGGTPPRWQFRGPLNLPVPYRTYYGVGLTSGRVNDVAFDPQDDNILYVASAGGGVWKSSDRGKNWTSLTDISDKWDNVKVSSIVVDPRNPKILYAGTGDFDGGAGVYGFGIMKSTDAGSHWVNVARQQLKTFSVRRLLVHPDDSQVLIAAAGRNPFTIGKLLRSPDGGASWQLVDLKSITHAVDADWEDVKCGIPSSVGQRFCYAVGTDKDSNGEVLRTSDKGVHWVRLKPPIHSAVAIAASPNSTKTVYLLGGADRQILKSIDSGDTWTNITGNFPTGDEVKEGYNWSQVDYDFFIATAKSPQTEQDIIYVGLIDLVASPDGGATWTSIGRTYQDDAITHNDQHCLAVDPRDQSTLFLGNDGGAYLIHYNAAATKWDFTSLNAQLGLTQFYKIAVSPSDHQYIFGGAQDNATPISFGDLKNWSNIGGGDGGAVAINSKEPDIQYASDQYLNLLRTTKHWQDWNPDYDQVDNDPEHTHNITYIDSNGKWSGDLVSFVAPIALDPQNPRLLYAGTNYLWRWDETSQAWERHLGGKLLADSKDAISAIAIAPSDSKTIYTGSQKGQLWVSADSGGPNSWKRVDSGISGTPRYWITSIAVHPTDPRTILVGLSGTGTPQAEHPGHVWRCTNVLSHLTCKPVVGIGMGALPNIPVNSIVIDPNAPNNTYYVATDVGVFMTLNGGTTWGDATKPLGLPNVQVNDLQFDASTKSLFAATFGRGVWQIDDIRSATLQPRPVSPASHKVSVSTRIKGKID